MKKIISVLTVLIILLNFAAVSETQSVQAISFRPSEQVYSDSAILYNIDTQTIVYEKNADKQASPAQLVQIMTAIVAIEKAPGLDSVVECPPGVYDEFAEYEAKYPEEEFPYNEVTTCYIEEGEQLSVEHLIYAMLLESSCEAASTLAYSIGEGSVKNFVNMMNEKAKEIGANNTNFANPHGLYDESQYTTAADLLTITNYALSLPGFSEIASELSHSTGPTNMHSESIEMRNVNLMMDPQSDYYFPGTKGIKTGNSNQSGRCLIARASRDGQNYIVVLLGAPFSQDEYGDDVYTHLTDAIMLFKWAFEYIEHKVVLQATAEIRTVKINYAKGKEYINLKPADDVKCMWLTTTDTSSINTSEIEYVYEELNAPVKAGDKLATLKLTYLGQELATVDLVAYSDAEVSYIKYAMALVESYFSSSALKTALKVATGLTGIYIVVAFYVINMRAKKRRERRTANNKLN